MSEQLIKPIGCIPEGSGVTIVTDRIEQIPIPDYPPPEKCRYQEIIDALERINETLKHIEINTFKGY